jgi:lauroyl/myristoyl acyltransferase
MTVRESIIRDILRLFVWFPLRWLISAVPTNAALFLFKLMGDMHSCASGGKKEKIALRISNLLKVDRKTAGEVIKRYYEAHYVDRLHIFLYPKLTTFKKIEKYVHIENIGVIETELRSGKGILIVQPHFGPVQITLLTLALLGYKPLQIGYPTDEGLSRIGRTVAFRQRLRYESMLPAQILQADEYLGKAYKHLLKGGVVLTTGDGAGRGILLGEHRIFNFLGTERMMPLGPASWALKTGAAFIPTFIAADKYNKFTIIFEEPIKGIFNDFEKDRVYMTERFISITEVYIKRYPFCWHFWDEI